MTRTSTPKAAVHTYIEAFNRGDSDGMAGCFAESGSILDAIAPHLWLGPSAAFDWWRDALTEIEHLGASHFHATLGAALHNDITGETAYYVAPAAMTFDLNGQQMKQEANFTLALRKIGADWKIAAWAWTKGELKAS